jgi:four helix bundle protein
MATIQQFEELDIWQRSRKLAHAIYIKTSEGPLSKDYSLRDQINRSSGSVMDNIAEGFERDGKAEFIQFLYSKESAGQTPSQLYRAFDRGYITKDEFTELATEAKEMGKNLGSFIKYLKKSDIRGTKCASEPTEEYLNDLPNSKFEI